MLHENEIASRREGESEDMPRAFGSYGRILCAIFLHLYLFDMHEEYFYRNSSAKNDSCHHLLTLMLLPNLYD